MESFPKLTAKYSQNAHSSMRFSHAKHDAWQHIPATTGTQTRSSFPRQTHLGVLKDWVPFLCSPSTEEFQLFMHLCPAVYGTGGTALGEASQGRPAFEDLIWLCIIQSPKSTFQRVTAALSAVSVHSGDLANGVWWNGTAHYIGDWL